MGKGELIKTKKESSTYLISGFTLIELLVVIAIIGILATVVIAVTSNSRDKAYNAKVQAQLKQAHNQAQLYTGTTNEFIINTCSTLTAAQSTIFNKTTGLGLLYNNLTPLTDSKCYSNTGASIWVMAFPLKPFNTGGSFCVDSTGIAKVNTNTPINSITNNACN